MSNLYIGTSGYDYNEWKGVFYPDNLKKTDYLSYYATQFNSLEINYTYYQMPTQKFIQDKITKTSGKVMFTIKAFQGLTHAPDKSQFQNLSNDFKKSMEPLQKNNLLLCVLLQFPESFHYETDERKYLDVLLKELSNLPVVVEMRNKKWQNDKVYNALRERNTGWCITDNPKLKNLPELEYIATSRIAYMRFHGRNSEQWYTGNNVSRYDYLYNATEIKSFVEPIKQLLKNTLIVQLFFSNHAKSQATINAKKIKLLLES